VQGLVFLVNEIDLTRIQRFLNHVMVHAYKLKTNNLHFTGLRAPMKLRSVSTV